jgi:hypothetical protein
MTRPRALERGLTVGGAVLVAIVLLPGCGESACADRPQDSATGAPTIEAFRLDNQLRGDPWTLVFATTFTDANGDLGDGMAEFFLNSSTTPTEIPLYEVFSQSDTPHDAASGTVAIPLRFGDDLSDGARVRLSLQLRDEADLLSNCYSLDLRFVVEAVSAALRRWWTEALAANAFDALGAMG